MSHLDFEDSVHAVYCADCEEFVGYARLNGDRRAVQGEDSEEYRGLKVGGWEYGAVIELLCIDCGDTKERFKE